MVVLLINAIWIIAYVEMFELAMSTVCDNQLIIPPLAIINCFKVISSMFAPLKSHPIISVSGITGRLKEGLKLSRVLSDTSQIFTVPSLEEVDTKYLPEI